MVSRNDVHAASNNPTELQAIKQQLIVEKMKLDKFFSVFLDNAEMDPDKTDTPEWVTYKEMLKDYNRVTQLITATDYYLR